MSKVSCPYCSVSVILLYMHFGGNTQARGRGGGGDWGWGVLSYMGYILYQYSRVPVVAGKGMVFKVLSPYTVDKLPCLPLLTLLHVYSQCDL